VLFLTPLQFVYLFCSLSKCILLLFSRISYLLLLASFALIFFRSLQFLFTFCNFQYNEKVKNAVRVNLSSLVSQYEYVSFREHVKTPEVKTFFYECFFKHLV
jgi:hypothetical protein